ncbi:SMI1/KNR4 family protein [Streptomyces sp. SID8379]|nr:SMI1/KNR4 family protein [Streptomyces sp. SID8379]MYW62480.1 SMI1/KNR4 family protein [Streptomyces sp. SID8379]
MERVQSIEERQVDDAWQRIETWLRLHAPATVDMLLPGASEEEIDALERELGVRIPVGLRTFWRRCAGTRPVPAASFMLKERAPMRFDAVVAVYQEQMLLQQRALDLSRRRGDGEGVALWRAAWIPVFSFGAEDYVYGLCLEAETGRLWSWSEFAERQVEFDSLTDYLEEMADVLETPSLAMGGKPGLIEGALVWGPPNDADGQALWQPVVG